MDRQINKGNISQLRDVTYKQPLSSNFEIDCLDASSSTTSTPRKKKLKRQIRFCENKIIKQGLKIKKLQSTNRRLKKKINNIDEILKRLEEKFAMTKENLDSLKNTNLEVCIRNFIKLLKNMYGYN